jgi:large subunit ribosomal protein L25
MENSCPFTYESKYIIIVSMFTLIAEKREKKDSLDNIRQTGKIPAVFYGNNKPTTSISVSTKDFIKVLKEAGESSTITLKTPDGNFDVLIHDIHKNPVTGTPMHADFIVVDMNKEIEVSVTIEFTGESGAEKGGRGVLVKALHEVQVKALPKDLPHTLEVDLSPLENVDDQITLKDIKLPKGVALVSEADEVVASVTGIKEEKEEEAPVADLSAIEVEKKGKQEEETAETTE